jgi:2-succinyl-6-hydroxy-2,4-cyclohexadiene-1-carboxylate synthase
MLPWRRWGQGPTRALFLHGFTGARSSFDHLEEQLGDALSATCLALPGHDAAPRPTVEGPAGFEEAVEAIARTMEEPAVVLGYSQGARLALALAVRHPRLVRRLVHEGCTPGFRRQRDRARRLEDDRRQADSLRAQGVEAFVERWERLPLLAGLRRLGEGDQTLLRRRRLGQTAEGLAAALCSLGQGSQPNLWGCLATLHIPTLVVTGALDRRYTELARRMVAELPLAWRATFDGAGHAPHLECPREYAREVRAFLASDWTHEPDLSKEHDA